MSCIFCDIVAGDAPAHVVFQTPEVTAFLDRTPLFAGHTLVVPNEHHVTLPDLPVDSLEPYFLSVRRLAAIMPDALGAKGTFVAVNNVVSQSVPHLHTHVVPRRPRDGLKGFFWPRTQYDDESHAAATASLLTEAWEGS